MSRKASKSGTIKKIFHAVSAVASPVLAVFGWLAKHTPKPHKKGGVHQTIAEKGKERSGMIGILWKVVLAVGIIAAAAFALGPKVKKWLTGKDEPVVIPPEPQPPKTEPVVSYQALYARKRELEQRMASVTGGDTGLFMLLEMMRDAASDGRQDSHYREMYRMKQDKLRGYMKDYRALLKQSEGAPEEEKRRFAPKEGLEQYQELLDEKI